MKKRENVKETKRIDREHKRIMPAIANIFTPEAAVLGGLTLGAGT